MNPSACTTANYADDQLLLFSLTVQCQVYMPAYYATWSVLIAARLVLMGIQFRVWRNREAKRKVTSNQKHHKHRLPLVPVLSMITTLLTVLMFALGAADIVNQYNGASFFLLGGFCLTVSIPGIFLLVRLVKLGGNVFRSKGSSSQNFASDEQARLSRFDWFLGIMFALCICSILQFFVVFVLFPLEYPGHVVLAQIGFSAMAQLIFLCGVCVIWQIERVIRAVRMHQIEAQAMFANAEKTQVDIALSNLRRQQAASLIFLPEAIFWALHASLVMPMTWYWLVEHTAAEIVVGLPLILVYLRPQKKKPMSPGSVMASRPESSRLDNPQL